MRGINLAAMQACPLGSLLAGIKAQDILRFRDYFRLSVFTYLAVLSSEITPVKFMPYPKS